MGTNVIYNEDCLDTMRKHILEKSVDIVLTSPPYNTGKKVDGRNEKSMKNLDARYDVYLEGKTDEQYIDWTIDLFSKFDNILKKNGCIIYNMSYSSGDKNNGYTSTDLMWKVVSAVITKTDFTIADRIIWKKPVAIPNNRSSNKLTRIVEDVFVFVRREDFMTFNSNKKVVSKSVRGQNNYENIYNFIEAANNDGSCSLNKATFSSELVVKLLDIYAKDGSIVYDPFMGTGTTAVGCIKKKMNYIGSELSPAQCGYARNRIEKETQQLSLF